MILMKLNFITVKFHYNLSDIYSGLISTDSNNFHDIVELIFLDPPEEFGTFLFYRLSYWKKAREYFSHMKKMSPFSEQL